MKQQDRAIDMASTWFMDTGYVNRQVFHIDGRAGTGKTYAVSKIIEKIGLDINRVAFATFSGKASLVLRRKGLPAQTIHHLIYDVKIESGKIKFVKKHALDFSLIVIDEASMVGLGIWNDLLSFQIPIILLGDTNQLPPIGDTICNHTKPDISLNEIIRQEFDNPIIKLSNEVLEGKLELDYGKYDNKVWVGPSEKITNKVMKKADIILCGKNVTRDSLNKHYRKNILGIETDMPIDGDKLICRKNNWNIAVGEDYPLINGMIGYISDVLITDNYSPVLYSNFRPDFLPEDDFVNNKFENLCIDSRIFRETNPEKKKILLKDNINSSGEKFEYGYAITTHLAQGSEWNTVLCYFEYMGSSDFMRKWLYTAITRSSNRLYLAY